MSNETPGRDAVPGWGQPEPQPDAPTAPWPTPPEHAETPWPAETDAPAAPAAPAAPWGSSPEPAPPAPAAPWAAEPATAPVPATTWAPAPAPAPAPALAQPAAPATWGAPPQAVPPPQPAPQQQPPTPGGWGAPPAQQAPSWSAAPPQQPTPQQQPPGGWGAPPPQGGWAPGGPGAPGGPPVGWAPAPARTGGNGCLKGCLIVGAIGVVLVIILVVAVSILGMKFAQDLGVNPDGTLTECTIVSSADVSGALGGQSEALPLGGIVDATIGQVLDKRVIPAAEDCWVAGDNTATGRVARQAGGDASGAFRSAKDTAKASAYFAGDVSGIGDEAFCTGVSEAASFGVLVRRGDTLVYVSLIDPAIAGSGFQTNAEGVVTSPETCALAQEVARKVLR